MSDCIFCQIAKGKLPAKFEYKDKDLVVFADINPQAPIHFLIIPRRHIKEFTGVSEEIFSKMLGVAKKLIKTYNLKKRGYRLVVNGGGAALINHLHLHLLGGITPERAV